MADISNEEFLRETQRAVERMREMNSKSKFDRSVHKCRQLRRLSD